MKLLWKHLSLLGFSALPAFAGSIGSPLQQPILSEPVLTKAPEVVIRNGTIIGTSVNGTDTFLGIPFARPPVGPLRLRQPLPLGSSFGTLNATSLPRACPQQLTFGASKFVAGFLSAAEDNPGLQEVIATFTAGIDANFTGEDCLTLNIQRRAGTKSSSKLPVLFWIYGGGWEIGSTQFYDATQILAKAASLDHDFIFVAANYRLGAFGFLPGQEAQAEGNTNLGLHDQRLAMKWVQENIGAFGGDPETVTIWGESAGAVSSFIHLLANDGNTDGLFRAAMMESGMAYDILPVDSKPAQKIFDQVAEYCNCSRAADKMDCLRSVPYEVFQGASQAQPNIFEYQSLAIFFGPRPDSKSKFYSRSPYDSLRRGLFARVPIIGGNQEDEGTVFSVWRGQDTLSTTDQIISYFTTWAPNAARETVARFVETYSPDPAAGSPFRTGLANEIYGGYKRVAAIVGDWILILARRVSFHYMVGRTPAIYGYIQTFFHGLPVLGTFHLSDTVVEFNGAGFPQVQDAVLTYYTSFIYYLDPNKLVDKLDKAYGQRVWPQWTAEKPVLLEFGLNSSAIQPDTFRENSYNVFLEVADELVVV